MLASVYNIEEIEHNRMENFGDIYRQILGDGSGLITDSFNKPELIVTHNIIYGFTDKTEKGKLKKLEEKIKNDGFEHRNHYSMKISDVIVINEENLHKIYSFKKAGNFLKNKTKKNSLAMMEYCKEMNLVATNINELPFSLETYRFERP